MRLAAALICLALLLPATAALAVDPHEGTACADSPGEQLESIIRADAPKLAEGLTPAANHQVTVTTEATPAALRTGSLLWWLGIVIGQDRLAALQQAPSSP